MATKRPNNTWKELLQLSMNKSRKVYGGNFVQLATVGGDGRPKVRTVVFRGFWKKDVARIITNFDSEKVAQLRANSFAEIAWWFPASREQFRIAGTIEIVDASCSDPEKLGLRATQWKELSEPAREQFFWPKPGSLVPDGAGSFREMEECKIPIHSGDSNLECPQIVPPPETFVLLLLSPDSVKYLDLRDNYAQLDVLDTSSCKWSISRVVP